jgi:hypothetical protein
MTSRHGRGNAESFGDLAVTHAGEIVQQHDFSLNRGHSLERPPEFSA